MCTLRVGASNFLSWSAARDFSLFARVPGTIFGPLFSREPRRVNETSEDSSGKNEPRINQIFALRLGEQYRLKVPKPVVSKDSTSVSCGGLTARGKVASLLHGFAGCAVGGKMPFSRK